MSTASQSLRTAIMLAIHDPGQLVPTPKSQPHAASQADAVLHVLQERGLVEGKGESGPIPEPETSTGARATIDAAALKSLLTYGERIQETRLERDGWLFRFCDKPWFFLEAGAIDHIPDVGNKLERGPITATKIRESMARLEDQLDRPIDLSPGKAPDGWRLTMGGAEGFALAGYHYAEGPGDLRIRTNDWRLLEVILMRLQEPLTRADEDKIQEPEPDKVDWQALADFAGYKLKQPKIFGIPENAPDLEDDQLARRADDLVDMLVDWFNIKPTPHTLAGAKVATHRRLQRFIK